MKPISDLSSTPKIGSSDLEGLLVLKEFLDSSEPGTRSCTVVMDEAIHQDDRSYKNVLGRMRKGDLDDDILGYMLSRSLDNMNNEEKEIFESTALHIMPTWEITKKVT